METQESGEDRTISKWTPRRVGRIARWVVPTVLFIGLFTPVGRFWINCVVEGFEIGVPAVHITEAVCGLIGTLLGAHIWFFKTGHGAHKVWHSGWEPKVMKTAFSIFFHSVL